MSDMLLNLDSLGFYEPGFLHLRVNTDEDISDLNELARNPARRREFSTFLHEYVHFLQDVTTTSGLIRAGIYIDYIKEINFSIRNDGKDEFDVPVVITNDFNFKANDELQRIYRGQKKGPDMVLYSHYEIETCIVNDRNGQSYEPKKYIVHYIDSASRSKGKFHFGSICIMEYMAHAIQKKYLPSVEHGDIPYQIVELIVRKECPEFGGDPMLIVAFCDACLMHLHPAQLFFNNIERMKSEKFQPQTPEDVYDFVFATLKFEGHGESYDVSSLYDKIKNHTVSQFHDALKSDIFASSYQWLKLIIERAEKIRFSQQGFFSKLVNDEGSLSDVFYDIFGQLGTPFFTNKLWKGGIVPPKDIENPPGQPYQLLVFKEITRVYSGHNCCELYDFCKLSPEKDITNHLCKTAPWQRATDDQLCPFAQFWKTWDLVGQIPVPRS